MKQEKVKSWILYRKEDIFILLWHPDVKINNWGCSVLQKPITYIDVKAKIKWHSYILGNVSDCDFHYLIFTDTDTWWMKERVKGIESNINKYCVDYRWKIIPILAYKEIETWFLAWIGSDFLNVHNNVNLNALGKFLKKRDIEKIDDTKEILINSVLAKTEIGWYWKQELIWREFWKYIDVDQAKTKSRSFAKFINELDSIFIFED